MRTTLCEFKKGAILVGNSRTNEVKLITKCINLIYRGNSA